MTGAVGRGFPINHPMRDGIAKPWGVIPPPTVPGHQRRIFQQPRPFVEHF